MPLSVLSPLPNHLLAWIAYCLTHLSNDLPIPILVICYHEQGIVCMINRYMLPPLFPFFVSVSIRCGVKSRREKAIHRHGLESINGLMEPECIL